MSILANVLRHVFATRDVAVVPRTEISNGVEFLTPEGKIFRVYMTAASLQIDFIIYGRHTTMRGFNNVMVIINSLTGVRK